jgi:hypothetical protein
MFLALGRNKKEKGLMIIWHAILWSIWKSRNDLSVNKQVKTTEAVVNKAKKLLASLDYF